MNRTRQAGRAGVAGVTAFLSLMSALVGCGPVERTPAAAPPPLVALPPSPLPDKALVSLDKLSPPIRKPVDPSELPKLSDRAARYAAKARTLLAEGDFAQSAFQFEKALGYQPDHPRLLRGLGLAYFEMKNYGKAADALGKAAAAVPDDLRVQVLLGCLAAANKQYDKAIVALRTALKCTDAAGAGPIAAEALLRLGPLLEGRGYWTASLECFTRLEEMIRARRHDFAAHAPLKTVVLKPEVIYERRGALLLRLRRHAEALGVLQRAHSRSRRNPRIVRLLVSAMIRAEKPGRAEKVLRLLAKLLDEKAWAADAVRRSVDELVFRGVEEGFERRFADQLRDKQSARAHALHYVAAALAAARGERRLAEDQLRLAIRARRDFFCAWDALLELLLAAGRDEDVNKLLDEIEAVAGESYFHPCAVGKAMLAHGKVTEAIEQLRRARSRDAGQIPALLLLARAHLRLRQPREAIAVLNEARRLDVNEQEIYRLLFDVAVSQRSRRGAREVAEQLRRRRPDCLTGRVLLARCYLLFDAEPWGRAIADRLRGEAPYRTDVKLLAIRANLSGGLTPKADFDRIVSLLQGIIDRELWDLPARRMLRDVCEQAGEPSRLADVLKGIHELTGSQPAGALRYAAALLRAGRYDETLAVVRGVLEADAKNPTARLMLLETLKKLEDYDQAARKAREWLKDAPAGAKNAYRMVLLGIYKAAKDYPRAQEILDEWISAGGDEVFSTHWRSQKADLYAENEQYDEAHKVLDGLIAAEKHSISVLVYRIQKIMLYRRANERKKAEEYGLAWIAESPKAPGPRTILVEVIGEGGEYARALRLLDKWMDAVPATTQPATQPATPEGKLLRQYRRVALRLLLAHEKHSQALARAEKYVKLDTKDAELLSLKSSALSGLGRHDEAIEVAEKALDLKPGDLSDASLANNLGYMYAERGIRLERAERILLDALKQWPTQTAFQDSLAWVYYKRGDFRGAGAILRTIVEQDQPERPDHPVIYDHAGDTYYRLGWKLKAVEFWRRAVEQGEKEKSPMRDTRRVLKSARAKIKAVRAGRQPPLAPIAKK